MTLSMFRLFDFSPRRVPGDRCDSRSPRRVPGGRCGSRGSSSGPWRQVWLPRFLVYHRVSGSPPSRRGATLVLRIRLSFLGVCLPCPSPQGPTPPPRSLGLRSPNNPFFGLTWLGAQKSMAAVQGSPRPLRGRRDSVSGVIQGSPRFL